MEKKFPARKVIVFGAIVLLMATTLLYHMRERIDIKQDNPYFNRIVSVIIDILQQPAALEHIQAVYSRPAQMEYDLYFELYYRNPVKVNFTQEEEIQYFLVDLPGTVLLNDELEAIVDELLLRWRGVTRNITADQIDKIIVDYLGYVGDYSVERIEVTEQEDFVRIADAFNKIHFSRRVDGAWSYVKITLWLKDGRKIAIEDLHHYDSQTCLSSPDPEFLRVTYFYDNPDRLTGKNTSLYVYSPDLAEITNHFLQEFWDTKPPLGTLGPRMVRPGGKYTLYYDDYADYKAFPDLAPSSKEIAGGTAVEVLEVYREWAFVKSEDTEGWIPWWCLLEDATPVRELDSACKVINTDTEGYLYPDGPITFDLTRGKLAKPINAWGDWVEVRVALNNYHLIWTMWLKADFLSEPDEVEPLEGILKAGSTIYSSMFDQLTPSKTSTTRDDRFAFIIEQKDEYVYLNIYGWQNAWTKKENLVFRTSRGIT